MTTALETVQQIYAAFGRGDVPAILDCLDDDVKWEAWARNSAQAAGVPWMRGGSGKAAAAEFFGIVGAFKFNDFQVLGMMASDRRAAMQSGCDRQSPRRGIGTSGAASRGRVRKASSARPNSACDSSLTRAPHS